MIENFVITGEPITPAGFSNEELLEAKIDQKHKRHLALICTYISIGTLLATFAAVLTTEHSTPSLIEAAAFIALSASFTFGISASDANRDLAIINDTVERRNQYRHPDDQLV